MCALRVVEHALWHPYHPSPPTYSLMEIGITPFYSSTDFYATWLVYMSSRRGPVSLAHLSSSFLIPDFLFFYLFLSFIFYLGIFFNNLKIWEEMEQRNQVFKYDFEKHKYLPVNMSVPLKSIIVHM